MQPIDIAELTVRPFHLLDKEWALLVGGAERPNPMTVSWGGLGTLWNRPVVTVYVRPNRFTCPLLVAHPEFTLNFLPPGRKRALEHCGSHSGRDGDKWGPAGLAPERSSSIAVPRVAGARLAFECRVLATMDVDPERFLDPTIEKVYPGKDYHRVFLGQVLAAWGDGA